jgi:chemotaxis signal transduction protein
VCSSDLEKWYNPIIRELAVAMRWNEDYSLLAKAVVPAIKTSEARESVALLLRLDAASEVASLPAVYHLPGAPTGVVGLANRYGRVVPVVDLLSRWQTRDRLPVHPWLLVCGKGDEAVGLVVDSLPERMLFDHADVVPLAEHGGEMAPYVDAVYRKDERIWLDVDLEKLFAGIFNFEVE